MGMPLQPTDPRVVELAKHDGLVRLMLEHHVRLDRQGYAEMMFLFGDPPKKWTAELEDEIPELLRRAG